MRQSEQRENKEKGKVRIWPEMSWGHNVPALESRMFTRGQCQAALVGAAASSGERGLSSEGTHMGAVMTV